MTHRIASVDIGSNSVIMLVAEPDGNGGWTRLVDRVAVTRISEGLDFSGRLALEPVARTRAKLEEFALEAREMEVRAAMITGTAPFRRSTNGAEVAESLGSVFGAPVTVVSGEEEAALSLLATQRSFPALRSMLVVDVGGASTELIYADESGSEMVSMDIGSVRLTERCVPSHPLTTEAAAALAATIDDELARPEVAAIFAKEAEAVVGIAGTVTTLVTVALGMDDYDDQVVHGYRLGTGSVGELFEALAAESVEQRCMRPGLPAKRADVLPAGAFLLSKILTNAGASEVIVSDRGTRWGRLYRDA
ncbi:MAG: exopolyphosphatase/guanosine-5'-triphosphate,3'-diphosphate pyrophosphatase [Bradymonadia bacterium]|jgi:exopolyphosphatase/guanosine-5'-triphosphate,3'-diphosphate pyrophosphatase